MAKPALGRGLGALMGGTTAHPPTVPPPASTDGHPTEQVQLVSPDQLRRSPFQPRQEFPPEALQELADSIREQGIIQPLIVRKQQNHFELIAGERRWRAAQLAGLNKIPIIVRTVSDINALELALIENLQRENLNPIDEAQGYSRLITEFSFRQEDVATKVGRSRTVVANALRLLKLPQDIQLHVRDGRLSTGHAKVILGLSSPELQSLAGERILQRSLSVRQTEDLVAQLAAPSRTSSSPPSSSALAPSPSSHIADLETRMRERFGTKVNLRYKKGKGTIDIRFFSDDELERILQILQIQVD